MSFKKNIHFELLIASFFTITFLFFGPLEILLSQPLEFWFTVSDVIGIILIASLIGFMSILLCMFIVGWFGKKIHEFTMYLFAGISMGLYVQGNWMFVDYGKMDGSTIDWSHYSTWAICNSIIWIVIIIGIAFLLHRKTFTKVMEWIFIGIISVQLITLGVLLVQYKGIDKEPEYALMRGHEFRLSKNMDNMIVIVADGFDGVDFFPALEDEPELLGKFDGFTFYKDTAGTSLHTEESSATLLTGNQFVVGPSFADNVNQAYSNSTLYDSLYEYNYDSYLYVSNSKLVSPLIKDKIKNFSNAKYRINNYKDAFFKIYRMVSFKYMPHLLKKYYWYSSMDFSSLKGENEPFFYNYDLYDYITNNGVVAASTNKNIYQFFWIQGPHLPANTDRYCKKTSDVIEMEDVRFSDRQFEQTIGVIRLFAEIIDQLKKAGIYDNTTIVFTADHGWNVRPNPLLLVKPRHTHGELVLSTAPVSMIEDYIPTIEYFIRNDGNTTNTIYDIGENEDRDRPFYIYNTNYSDRTYNSRELVMIPQDAFLTEIRLNEDILPNNISTHVINGNSTSEIGHVWTEGFQTEYEFHIDDEFTDLMLSITYFSYGEQHVTAYANNEIIDSFIVNGEEERTFIIPRRLINGNVVNFKFELPDATQVGNRRIALAVKKMRFSDAVN